MKSPLYICAIALFTLPVIKVWGYTPDECVRCHRTGSDESKTYINVREYESSVHSGKLICVDCHEDVLDLSHMNHKLGRIDCQRCHEKPNLHAKDGSVPCKSCHPPHGIYPADDPRSSVNPKNLGNTCNGCHPAQSGNRGLFTFLESFQIASHPKQDFSELADKTMCLACHQGQAAHGEREPINHQNCPACHLPLGRNSSELGYIHMSAEGDKRPLSFIAGYINLLGSLAVAMFFAIAIKKTLR
jgi:hypothetical protein